MPARHHQPAQADVVSRRLSLLSAELAAVRDERPEEEYDDAPPTRPRLRAVEPETLHTRIRDGRWPEPEPADPPELPNPGRHASRLVARRLADQLPDTMRGRAAVAPTQLAVIVLVAAVALVVAAWWVVRSGSSGEAVPAALPPSPVAGLETPGARVGADPSASVSAAAASVVVDVAGKVRHPGIVVLKAGSRVVDAIEAAGGARPGVDLSTLNQARVLVDGEQILVGAPAVPGVAAQAAPSSSAGGPTTLVNINTADQAQLEELPGVGPVTAQSIIDWRTENGAFTSVDELLEVDGIGDATLADLAPYVTI